MQVENFGVNLKNVSLDLTALMHVAPWVCSIITCYSLFRSSKSLHPLRSVQAASSCGVLAGRSLENLVEKLVFLANSALTLLLFHVFPAWLSSLTEVILFSRNSGHQKHL